MKPNIINVRILLKLLILNEFIINCTFSLSSRYFGSDKAKRMGNTEAIDKTSDNAVNIINSSAEKNCNFRFFFNLNQTDNNKNKVFSLF